VVIKGDKKVEAGPARLLQQIISKLLLFSLFGLVWVLGAAWIRKNVSLSVSQSAAAGGTAAPGNYAPKEYNKENMPEKVTASKLKLLLRLTSSYLYQVAFSSLFGSSGDTPISPESCQICCPVSGAGCS
jgi:hypothetical protein